VVSVVIAQAKTNTEILLSTFAKEMNEGGLEAIFLLIGGLIGLIVCLLVVTMALRKMMGYTR
jgi:hypothetical protein